MATDVMLQVVGAFVKLSHWLPLVLDAVSAPQAALTTRINSLVVLSAMLYASGLFSLRTHLHSHQYVTFSRQSELHTLKCAASACNNAVACVIYETAATHLHCRLRSASMWCDAGAVQQAISEEQLALLVQALCSDAVRSADQEPAQLQLLAVIQNAIALAGEYSNC